MNVVYSFDSESGRLTAVTKNGVQFDLTLRGMLTGVDGDSATGKTMLADMVALSNVGVADPAVRVLNYQSSDSDIISVMFLEGKLIVIDNADVLLKRNRSLLLYLTEKPLKSRFLVFSRSSELGISPNYWGHLVANGKTIELKYDSSVREE